jgi:hypothetical protein
MKIILNMKRQPDRYYVVINALGSYEVWGANRNGDAFPEAGLKHKSLRTDMGTSEDFGFKSFEHYAKLFKHHVNKNPKESFGDIIFSHWNQNLHRVELIVGIDTEKGKDIIDSLDNGELVSVSMGARVKYDRCSICDNKASTRAKYCIHLRDYMGQIVTKDLADQWSRETGRRILPGTQVFAFNDYPRFFDISRVYVGADRTAYILGKAASKGHIFFSADIADVKGITDSMIDKLATVKKIGEIDKEIGGEINISNDNNMRDSDGIMVKSDEMTAIKKSLDEKMNNVIAVEPRMPNSFIDPMAASLPLETIFSTLFGLGIHPKPEEFQRIVLIKIRQKPLADELDSQNLVFDHNNNDIEPMPIDVSENDFSDTLGRGLASILPERSCFPSLLGPRMRIAIIKTAGMDLLNSIDPKAPKIDPGLTILEGLAALYAGLKLKAMGYGPKELASIFANKSWLIPLVGGSVMWKIYDEIDKKNAKEQMVPAREYANILQNTHFSGHMKQAAINFSSLANSTGVGLLTSAVVLPSAYIANAWNRKSLQTTGHKLFPGADVNPIAASVVGGLGAGGLSYGLRYGVKGLIDSGKGAKDAIKRGITKVLKK